MPISSKSKLSSHYYKAWWERVLKFGLFKKRTPQEMADKFKQAFEEERKNSHREIDEEVQKYLDEAIHNNYQAWKKKNLKNP